MPMFVLIGYISPKLPAKIRVRAKTKNGVLKPNLTILSRIRHRHKLRNRETSRRRR
jgi:hypothetical protein